jgi:hypothetical protein
MIAMKKQYSHESYLGYDQQIHYNDVYSIVKYGVNEILTHEEGQSTLNCILKYVRKKIEKGMVYDCWLLSF